MKLLTANTIAAELSNVWNAKRNNQFSAGSAFQFILNDGAPFADVARVDIANMTIHYVDGSVLVVMETGAAMKAGLTKFKYAFKSQDQLC